LLQFRANALINFRVTREDRIMSPSQPHYHRIGHQKLPLQINRRHELATD